MHKKTPIPLLFLFLIAGFSSAHGQACCSAGAPLLGALEFPSSADGVFTAALSWERNVMRDVLTGFTTLDDASRERQTDAGLLEFSYGLGNSFSVSLLASAVWHERRVRGQDGRTETIRTSGVGDLIVLAKYALIEMDILRQIELSIGAGMKVPLGASTLRRNGILLPADLQPGTGAWDAILWSYLSHGFKPQLPLTLFGTASVRLTGSNDRYGNSAEGYAFGNESIASIGASYRTDLGIGWSLTLQYRQVAGDTFDASPIPNTGGHWLNIRPGININIADPVVMRFSGSIPIYRDLNGTQLTTSFSTMLQFIYVLDY